MQCLWGQWLLLAATEWMYCLKLHLIMELFREQKTLHMGAICSVLAIIYWGLRFRAENWFKCPYLEFLSTKWGTNSHEIWRQKRKSCDPVWKWFWKRKKKRWLGEFGFQRCWEPVLLNAWSLLRVQHKVLTGLVKGWAWRFSLSYVLALYLPVAKGEGTSPEWRVRDCSFHLTSFFMAANLPVVATDAVGHTV